MAAVLRFDGLDDREIFLQNTLQYVLLPDEKLIEFLSFQAEKSRKQGGEKFIRLFWFFLVKNLHGCQVLSGQEANIATEKLQVGIDIVKQRSLHDSC